MITLKEYLEAIDYRISGGSEYQWDCFGLNARYLDCQSEVLNEYSITCVFDSLDQTVYTVEAWDYDNERAYRWIHPDYISKYKKSCKQFNVPFKEACDTMDFTDLDVVEDILEKARAISTRKEYDTRVMLPLTLDKDELHQMMLLAHEADMTLNAYVEMILQKVIDDTRTADQDS